MTKKMPSNSAVLWLMAGLTLGSIPLFVYQPIWVGLTFTAMILWRVLSITHHWPLPKKGFSLLGFIHLGIAASVIAMIIIRYGNLIGQDPGIALLTVMLSLKVVEMRSLRDYYLSCLMGYFLVATNFFYSQNIPTALLMFVVVVILTAGLILLNDEKQAMPNKSLFKLSAKMLLQAVPLMVLLFILFPRIPGPLWGIPQDTTSGTSGISDSMSLGSISQLTQSDEIAFRVKFEGDIPEQADRYWRGPVLLNYDGKTWTEFDNQNLMMVKPTITLQGKPYHYTTTIEPHEKYWLFALDFPQQNPSSLPSYLQYDGQLKTVKPVSQRQQITLTSYTDYRFNTAEALLKRLALELPDNKHPKAKALAQSWLANSSSESEVVDKALDYFAKQGFRYTLSPPSLSEDNIDSFLFDTKAGFCEYYSASFTVLMRAAGIPARVVTGYQGGEINPVDKYLTIRQYDAHAWAEVWIKDRGWLRIDPTSSVSSERIELGITRSIPETFNRPPAFIPNNKQAEDLWQSLKNNWGAVDNAWNQWVLGYGPAIQKEFLKKLGMSSPNWKTMAAWLIIGFALLSLLFSLYLLYNRPNQSEVSRLYLLFCRKAARMGCTRRPSQGPLDYAKILSELFPAQSADIKRITSIYIDLQYGKQQNSIAELKQAVKQFKPLN